MLAAMGRRDSDLETDAELWARVARSARPLKKGRAATAPVAAPKPRPKPTAKEPAPAAKPAPKPVPKRAQAARGEALDRQTARKLEGGRLAVEARLDLHGMRQKDAHAALRRFLKTAQGKGYRHVLVITGKGAPADEFEAVLSGGRARRAAPGRAALAGRAGPRACRGQLFGSAAAARRRRRAVCAAAKGTIYKINLDRSAFLARSPICSST